LRAELDKQKVTYQQNQTHITIIPIGDAKRCRYIAQELLKLGIYVQPINYPTVPVGEECLRIIVTNKHTLSHMQYLAVCLNKVLHGNHHPHRPQLETFAHPN
jgi:5-aminolevulinate synthase